MRAVILFLLLAPAAPFALGARTKPLTAAELKPFQRCEHASNCIRVTNGCCDCANGGDTASVSRTFDKKFEKLFQCETTMCSQKEGDCNFREPSCVEGRCELGPNKNHFPTDKSRGPLPRVQGE